LKRSLFAGVFDTPTNEVSFAALGRKSVLQAIKETFADQPARPKPVVETAQPAAMPVAAKPSDFEQATSGLVEAGIRFMEALSSDKSQALISNVFRIDQATNRPMLAIPLPESITRERWAGAVAGFLSAFTRGA
jgi:hypothetical protein